MTLTEQFQVTTGMTAGRYHRQPGSLGNSQDACMMSTSSHLIVGAVSDGCGSSPFSQFGAQLTVNLLCKLITKRFRRGMTLDQGWFDDLLNALVKRLKIAGRNFLHGELQDVIESHLMATAGGIIITDDTSYVFGAGDFFYGTDGEVNEWLPDKGNYPRYPIYPHAQFKVATYDTATLTTLFLGTDGTGDLLKVCQDGETMIPGTDDLVGQFSQIWTDDAFYVAPDSPTTPTSLATWLNSLATDVRQPGPPHHTGLLGDDTALVAIRRTPTSKKESENA